MDDLVELIARSTGLNEGTIWQVLIELRDATVFFNQRGQPVYLEGLGTYTPSIYLEGNVNIRHRADIKPKSRVNAPGAKTLGSAFPSTGSGQA